MAGIVDIVVGSESDMDLIDTSKMLALLSDCKIEWYLHIISAHRNPKELQDYCGKVASRGVRVIIATAGMAAALPGVIASELKFALPVIGVPLPSKEFPDALDALLSMVRMPGGCPVLVSGIGKAGLKNAAVGAIQIIAAGDDVISLAARKKLEFCLGGNTPKAQMNLRSDPKEGGDESE